MSKALQKSLKDPSLKETGYRNLSPSGRTFLEPLFLFTTEVPSSLWQNNDPDLFLCLNTSFGLQLTDNRFIFSEVEIAHHLLTRTSMQVSIFVIDLTSEQSHQPKRIIMREAVLMMALSFSALRHPVNFDLRNSLQ